MASIVRFGRPYPAMAVGSNQSTFCREFGLAQQSRNQRKKTFNRKERKVRKVNNQDKGIDSRIGAKGARCHFDRKEKSFSDPRIRSA